MQIGENDRRVRAPVSTLQPSGSIAFPPVLVEGFNRGMVAANAALYLPTTVNHSSATNARIRS